MEQPVLIDENKNLRTYLEREWRYNVHKKYHKYFDEWFSGLTDTQIMFFTCWMSGGLSPYAMRE